MTFGLVSIYLLHNTTTRYARGEMLSMQQHNALWKVVQSGKIMDVPLFFIISS
jgi:hypothetical protein